MADILKAEGLVLAIDYGGNIYPMACAKNSSFSVTSDFLELAPKTSSIFKEYLPYKKHFTISGSGLNKLAESYKHPLTFFNAFAEGNDVVYTAYMDLIDNSSNYGIFKFNCYISTLSVDSNYGENPSYSFTLQGTGAIERLTISDNDEVWSGSIPGRSTTTYKLVALGYGGKWYYNYAVSGSTISIPGVANGTLTRAVYIAL